MVKRSQPYTGGGGFQEEEKLIIKKSIILGEQVKDCQCG